MLWLLAAVVGACATGGEPTPTATPARGSVLATSRAVLSLELPRLGGGTLQFGATGGRTTVVFFFATWSLRAQAEASHFAELSAAFAKRARIVGVALDRRPALVKAYVEAMALPFPVALAEPTHLEMVAAFGLTRVVPRTIVFDGQGRILQRHEKGQTDFDSLRRLLRGL